MLKPLATSSALDQPDAFRSALTLWFRQNARIYPWRQTTDPWAILVSEVMLQQTQIATVLQRGFYTRFLERFPTPADLAQADDPTILKAWEGLGYYRRVRMLRETARAIAGQHQGRFPSDPAALRQLPGIGPYTAGALLSFAFNHPAPLVDGNVARVFSRLFDSHRPIDTPAAQKWLWQTAETLVFRENPRAYNAALMELGQTLCRPGVPDCLSCPVSRFCLSPEPHHLPLKSRKITPEAVTEHSIILIHHRQILLRHVREGRRSGMWRLPERSAAALDPLTPVHRNRYGITRYKVTQLLYTPLPSHPSSTPLEDESWHPLDHLESLVMPPADRKALAKVLQLREEIA